MFSSRNLLSAVAVFALLTVDFSVAAPHRHGLASFRHPDQLVSTDYGRELENRMRLGVDKEGITEWSVESQDQAGRLRHGSFTPTEIIAPKAQLSGELGNAQPPRRLRHPEQYRPPSYDPPIPGLASAPGGLKSLTIDEKDAIATEFLVKFKYSDKERTDTDKRSMVTKVQKNYGIKETGQLDDTTVIEMLRPRCGFPDGPAEYNTFSNREHWRHKNVTYFIKGYSPDMSQCQIRNTLKRAFRVWEEVTDLTFEMVDSDDADIIIFFGFAEHGDGYPFDSQNGLLAHAFAPGYSKISGDTHFDESEFWTLGKGKVFDTYYGNSDGDPCVFPFYFNKKMYHGCTSEGRNDGLEWCATTADYDKDEKFALCPHELLFTYGGNGEGKQCTFPFEFLGKTYDSCTYEGRSDGYRWCATTSNFDKDSKWGFCPSRAHGTEGGNSEQAACKFPFTFEGSQYSQCTTRGRSDYRLWCSTTDNFDKDKLWGFCGGSGYSLFLVAAHEFGHAIGLAHSSERSALMYPSYSFVSDFALPDDDIRGARDLYDGPRTKYLPPLQLEKCGGNLKKTDPGPVTQTPPPTAPATTTMAPRSSTTHGTVDKCDDTVPPKSICERPIDAVMMYQQELFIFQGPFLWRVYGKGKTQRRFQSRVAGYWPVLKCGVDAAYQRPDETLVFFKGSQYYEFDRRAIARGYPKDVTEIGLPARSVVDDVVYMESMNQQTKKDEGRTYYFVGGEVYRADNKNGTVLKDLKPTILGESKEWADLPGSIDAAYRESLHKPFTVFVKDGEVYRYQNKKERVKPPKSGNSVTVEKFFGC